MGLYECMMCAVKRRTISLAQLHLHWQQPSSHPWMGNSHATHTFVGTHLDVYSLIENKPKFSVAKATLGPLFLISGFWLEIFLVRGVFYKNTSSIKSIYDKVAIIFVQFQTCRVTMTRMARRSTRDQPSLVNKFLLWRKPSNRPSTLPARREPS